MANTFFLRIIASNGIFFEGRIQSVIFGTIDGQKELMARHEEMIIAVAEGEIKYHLPDGDWVHAVVGVGTAQFANNRCTILVETCEKPENVEKARAQAAKEAAE
ncbi:MAG: ATP synthase F1 subunit epsilon, partial [Lachnospiraceae bacterium]|nr:ATP synthase F1 subunit epsilon [Lachnospiraceae bacterium]